MTNAYLCFTRLDFFSRSPFFTKNLDSDVCYSVMPLFHIGGISASILCTLVSGGSVCCDGEPFDPGHMLDALAVSRPQPTW
jgi:acyl-CoA synthetase (AMP-forming)/AMP-acid ligase II